PWQYFTDHRDPGLAEAVRRGRRAEVAAFGGRPPHVPDPPDPATLQRPPPRWEGPGREPPPPLLGRDPDPPPPPPPPPAPPAPPPDAGGGAGALGRRPRLRRDGVRGRRGRPDAGPPPRAGDAGLEPGGAGGAAATGGRRDAAAPAAVQRRRLDPGRPRGLRP